MVLVPAEVKYDFDVRTRPNIALSAVDDPGAMLRWLFWRSTQALHSRLKVHSLASSRAMEIHGVDTFPIIALVRFLLYFQLRKWLEEIA
jgi:hypothetical protein